MWLLEQVVYPIHAHLLMEHLYEESGIAIVKGRCVVERYSSMQTLQNMGYRLMAQCDGWEDVMRTDLGHVIELGFAGLGPLKGVDNDELVRMRDGFQSNNSEMIAQIYELIAHEEAKAAPIEDANHRGLSAADIGKMIVDNTGSSESASPILSDPDRQSSVLPHQAPEKTYESLAGGSSAPGVPNPESAVDAKAAEIGNKIDAEMAAQPPKTVTVAVPPAPPISPASGSQAPTSGQTPTTGGSTPPAP